MRDLLEMGPSGLPVTTTAVPHVYSSSTRVVDVDANQPVERVLSEAKHAIWDSI